MLNTQVGPFLIVNRLGTNRRQQVFHARQVSQDRDVALKFISIPDDIDFASSLEKIDIEAKELQKLKHPNLVKFFGAGAHEERIFFANELVDGESLDALLSRRGKLPPDLVLDYGKQIADLLMFLHQKDLLHTNLTPEKILVTRDHQIKVAGLRLNRPRRRRWDSSRPRDLDSAAYLAPEQLSEGATNKSDLYSLGMVLFEMLAGKLPYEPDTLARMTQNKLEAPVPSVAAHVMNCPVWLDKLIRQMLHPNPRKRPHSSRAVALTLEEIKKLDSTQKAAVDQISASFNPLNAGKDKSEARKILGRKAPQREEPENSFFQSVPFMVASLMLILGLVIFMMLPAKTSEKIQQAAELVQSENPNDWTDARSILKPIMESDGKYTEQAEQLYFDSRRKSLVRQAERGISNRLQSENVRLFGKGVRLQQDGRIEEAVVIFKLLVKSIGPDEEEFFVREEAQQRITAIENDPPLPTDPVDLFELVKQASLAESRSELEQANRTLSKIMIQFSGESKYQKIIQATMNLHPKIRNRLAQATQTRPPDKTE